MPMQHYILDHNIVCFQKINNMYPGTFVHVSPATLGGAVVIHATARTSPSQ